MGIDFHFDKIHCQKLPLDSVEKYLINPDFFYNGAAGHNDMLGYNEKHFPSQGIVVTMG